MDDASLERMAFRVAGSSGPDVDQLYELEKLVGECRLAVALISSGVSEGRLSEETMTRLWASLQDRARGACEGMRSCLHEMEGVLPRASLGRETVAPASAPAGARMTPACHIR